MQFDNTMQYIPNRVLHPYPILNTMRCVDHVSFLIDFQTVEQINQILNFNHIQHDLLDYQGNLKHQYITIAYSYHEIKHNGLPPRYMDLDPFPYFIPLETSHESLVNYEITNYTDINGNTFLAMVLDHPYLVEQHLSFIQNNYAEWPQGIYKPFIKLSNQEVPGVNIMGQISLSLVGMRFMRFGESL